MAKQFTEVIMQQGGATDDSPAEQVSELIEEKNRLERELSEREEQIVDFESEVTDLRAELAERPAVDVLEQVHYIAY